MTVKHSPGPFAAPDGQFIRDAQDRIIAGVVPWNAPPEECAHNVALFTAAPELADALQTLLSDLSNDGQDEAYPDQMDAARAALRKAGRE